MVRATVLAALVALAAATNEDVKLIALDGVALDGFGKSVALDGALLVAGAPSSPAGAASGAAYVYLTADQGASFSPQQKLVMSDAANGDNAGAAVGLSGSICLVGAPGDASSTGAVYSWTTSDGGATWTEQAKVVPSTSAAGDTFGAVLAISGSIAVVGSPLHDPLAVTDAGAVYTFTTSNGGSSWTERVILTKPAVSGFGSAVAIDTITGVLVVGVPLDDDNGASSGSAFVYRTDDSGLTYTEKGNLLPSDGAASDEAGYSVAVAGENAFVSSWKDDDNGSSSGSVYQYNSPDAFEDGPTESKYGASDAGSTDQFSSALAADGDYLVVGANSWNAPGTNNVGAVYIFAASGVTFVEQEIISASDYVKDADFGISVDIDDGLVAIGAPEATGNALDAGAVYVRRVAVAGAVGDPLMVDLHGHRFLAGSRPNSLYHLISYGSDRVLIKTSKVRGVKREYFVTGVTVVRAGCGMATITAVPGRLDTTVDGDPCMLTTMASGDHGMVAFDVGRGEGMVAVVTHVFDSFTFLNIRLLSVSQALRDGCWGMLCNEKHMEELVLL